MSERKKGMTMGLAIESYPESCHVCLIYDDEEQRRKAVSEYIAAGFARGEQIRYFADRSTPEEIRACSNAILRMFLPCYAWAKPVSATKIPPGI